MCKGLFTDAWDTNSHTTRESHPTTDNDFSTAALLRVLPSLANFPLCSLQGRVQLGQSPTQLVEQSTILHDGLR